MASYALAVAALILVLVAWVGVQVAWRKVFPGVGSDPDVLAGRMGCHGCDCQEDVGGHSTSHDGTAARQRSDRCRRKRNVPGSIEEEIS